MGYDTYIHGELTFSPPLSEDELHKVRVLVQVNTTEEPAVTAWFAKGGYPALADPSSEGFNLSDSYGSESELLPRAIAWLADVVGGDGHACIGSFTCTGAQSDDMWSVECHVKELFYDDGEDLLVTHEVTTKQARVMWDADGTPVRLTDAVDPLAQD